MKGGKSLSEEILNAFVDNELDAAERRRIFELLHQDPLLAQRVCELTHMKELVKAARPDMAASSAPYKQRHCNRYVFTSAAMFLIVLGVASMTFLFDRTPVHSNMDSTLQAIIESPADEIKVVMQITQNDQVAIDRLLKRAEYLVSMGSQLERPVRIEVVAYGPGLSMLRSDQSPYAERIMHLHKRYDNLLFVACQETLQKQQQGKSPVRLLQGVMVAPTGKGEVRLRRSQGWSIINT